MTHINAYYADVEDKKKAVIVAQGELQTAEQALQAHPDYVPETTSDEQVEVKPVEASHSFSKRK